MAIDNKDKKILNVPHLRFPEFNGEWETKLINDLAVVIGGGTPDTTIKSYWDGEIQWFTPSEIGKNKYVDSSLRTITEEGLNNSSAKLLPPNTILLSSRATIGECSLSLRECATNQGFQSLVSKKCYVDFLYYLIQTKKRDLIRKSCGSTFLEISANEVRKIQVSVPTDVEQQKIAGLLSLIDERIATQNKNIEKLQSLIKGLRVCCMQRVYGNNVYLSEIAQIYQPQTISSTELTEDGFLVYGANGIIGKYKDYNHETEQICITCRGNTCGMVNYTKPMSWITGNAMVINTDKYQDKVCKRYLYHYLSAYNFNSIISGSGQPQIVRTPLEKLKITLPTISEQKQKAIIFDKIQDKIDINHKVLNLYIGQKQYLLRQMFI
ncbi:MAG: restriction endonuclease subunit S [Parabacteroides distasonis]|nr:restriction endonuclease subunit S [Parabacteroides distasonis]